MSTWLEEAFNGGDIRDFSSSQEMEARIDAFDKSASFPEKQVERTVKRVWLAEKLPRQAIGAEIGVFRGHFAEVLCRTAKPNFVYLIDPWTVGGDVFTWGAAYTNNKTLKTIDAYEEAKLRVARGGAKEVLMIQGYFPDCAGAIKHPLDWVYLDASHSYEGTLAQLVAIDSIMNPTGIIAGDDWSPDPAARHHGVFRAVQEFVVQSRWKIVMCGYLSQWMLRRI